MRELYDQLLQWAIDNALFDSHCHGPDHWNRVARNVLFLRQHYTFDVEVGISFALLHDCQRKCDGDDSPHGLRGKILVEQLTHQPWWTLTKNQTHQVQVACQYHTQAQPWLWLESDTTTHACFDADRLDLVRVGIDPDSAFLFTQKAKQIADEMSGDALEEWLTQYDYLLDNL